jgi:hypothetical protein
VQFGNPVEDGVRHPERRGQDMVWRPAQGYGDADIVAAFLGAVVEHDQKAEIFLADILEVTKKASYEFDELNRHRRLKLLPVDS